jgi:hypothetical protein
MKTRFFILSVVFLMLMSFASSGVFARGRGRPVTPYGDFCPECGKYGTCKSMMNPEDAEKAIFDYYKEKNLEVEILSIRKRFIKANVKDNGTIVDVIIFDRRNGRVRSIY